MATEAGPFRTSAEGIFVGHQRREASQKGSEVTLKSVKKKGEIVTQPLCLDEC